MTCNADGPRKAGGHVTCNADGSEEFLSASLLVPGIVVCMFRLVATCGKTPLKFLSEMICETLGH